jgi:hypothetical protein
MSDLGESAGVPAATIRMGDYKAIYSDVFSVRVTGVDFTFTFGVHNLLPTEQGRVQVTLEQIAVSMTLPLAKAIAINLRNVVQAMEDEIGPIPTSDQAIMPESFLETVRQNLRANPLITKGIAEFDRSSN